MGLFKDSIGGLYRDYVGDYIGIRDYIGIVRVWGQGPKLEHFKLRARFQVPRIPSMSMEMHVLAEPGLPGNAKGEGRVPKPS